MKAVINAGAAACIDGYVEDNAAAGCSYMGLVWSYPPDEMLTRLRWFKKEVMAKVRAFISSG